MEEQLLITEVEKYTQIRKISTPKGGVKKAVLTGIDQQRGGCKRYQFWQRIIRIQKERVTVKGQGVCGDHRLGAWVQWKKGARITVGVSQASYPYLQPSAYWYSLLIWLGKECREDFGGIPRYSKKCLWDVAIKNLCVLRIETRDGAVGAGELCLYLSLFLS